MGPDWLTTPSTGETSHLAPIGRAPSEFADEKSLNCRRRKAPLHLGEIHIIKPDIPVHNPLQKPLGSPPRAAHPTNRERPFWIPGTGKDSCEKTPVVEIRVTCWKVSNRRKSSLVTAASRSVPNLHAERCKKSSDKCSLAKGIGGHFHLGDIPHESSRKCVRYLWGRSHLSVARQAL